MTVRYIEPTEDHMTIEISHLELGDRVKFWDPEKSMIWPGVCVGLTESGKVFVEVGWIEHKNKKKSKLYETQREHIKEVKRRCVT